MWRNIHSSFGVMDSWHNGSVLCISENIIFAVIFDVYVYISCYKSRRTNYRKYFKKMIRCIEGDHVERHSWQNESMGINFLI